MVFYYLDGDVARDFKDYNIKVTEAEDFDLYGELVKA